MEFGEYLSEVETQAAALRAVAVEVGPDTPVPTCPEWTVRGMVRHIAMVHNWVVSALHTEPGGTAPSAAQPPEEWDDLLGWWDDQLATMLGELRAGGQDAPAWAFPTVESTSAFWARRQAHETAIHRLDAEHARAGSDRPDSVPSLIFEPELAADGIDEALVLMVPRKLRREGPPEVEGTVLFHAADAGRAWLVELKPGEVPSVGPADVIDTDASVVGTADAVYRAVWHRPSTAITNGDRTLVDLLRTP